MRFGSPAARRCMAILVVAAGAAFASSPSNADDWMAFGASPANPNVYVIGYGNDEPGAKACVARITGTTDGVTAHTVPYDLPDCPHPEGGGGGGPGGPGGPAPAGPQYQLYEFKFSVSGFPGGQLSYRLTMPVDTAGSKFNEEVIAPLAGRMIAMQIVKATPFFGSLKGFSIETDGTPSASPVPAIGTP